MLFISIKQSTQTGTFEKAFPFCLILNIYSEFPGQPEGYLSLR